MHLFICHTLRSLSKVSILWLKTHKLAIRSVREDIQVNITSRHTRQLSPLLCLAVGKTQSCGQGDNTLTVGEIVHSQANCSDMEHIQRLCNRPMHEQTSSVWPQQQKAPFSSLQRHHAHKHTRTIIIPIISLEPLIYFKTRA